MTKQIEKASDAINNIGNVLTAANWPGPTEHSMDSKEAYKNLVFEASDLFRAVEDLRDCVNELCLKCGQYKTEHLGSCDGCRWKEIRHDS